MAKKKTKRTIDTDNNTYFSIKGPDVNFHIENSFGNLTFVVGSLRYKVGDIVLSNHIRKLFKNCLIKETIGRLENKYQERDEGNISMINCMERIDFIPIIYLDNSKPSKLKISLKYRSEYQTFSESITLSSEEYVKVHDFLLATKTGF